MFRVNSNSESIFRHLYFIFFLFCAFISRDIYANERRTKLCADVECKADLFTSHFTREWDTQDTAFLKTKLNLPVKVVAFRFSNRPDFMEAETDGKRGLIMNGFIDLVPYVIFLESALKTNQTFYMMEQMTDWPKLIQKVSAVPDLTREYMTYAKKENYQLDEELVTKLEESQKTAKPQHNHHHHDHHSHQGVKEEFLKKQPEPVQQQEVQEVNEQAKKETMQLDEKLKVNSIDGKGTTQPVDAPKEMAPNPESTTMTSKEETKNDPIKLTGEEQLEPKPEMKNKEEELNKENKQESRAQKELPSENEHVVGSEQEQKHHHPLPQKTPSSTQQTTDQNKDSIPDTIPTPIPQDPIMTTLNAVPSQAKTNTEQTENKQKQHEPEPSSTPSSVTNPQTHTNDGDVHSTAKSIENINQDRPTNDQLPLNQNTDNQKKQESTISSTPTPSSETQSSHRSHNIDVVNQPPPIQNDANHEQILVSKNEETNDVEIKQAKQQLDSPSTSSLPQTQHVDDQTADGSIDESVRQSVNEPSPHQDQVNQKNQEHEISTSTQPLETQAHQQLRDVDIGPSSEAKSIENTNQQTSIDPLLRQHDDSHEILTSVKISDQKDKMMADDDPKNHNLPEQREKMELKTENNVEEANQDKQKYCFKEDCQEFDNPTSDRLQSSSSDSGLRIMFREWMASLRAFLPQPFCHFEDTGLIVLAFVLISILIHLINWCLSSTNPNSELLDGRLFHDCITRLKEQEIIIEKNKENSIANQRLLKAANAAEQLQKQKVELEQRLKATEQRLSKSSEIEAENVKLKKLLKDKQNELELDQTLKIELEQRLKTAEQRLSKSSEIEAENEKLKKLLKEKENELELNELEHDPTINSELKASTERHELTSKLLQLIEEKDRKVEHSEQERHELTPKLLQMIEEKDRKLEHSEQEREKLRNRLSEVEMELRRMENEKRDKQYHLKELEQSLKQAKELNGRLENRLYHEERRFNTKLRQLEEQLSIAKTSLSPLNMSGGGISSDLNISGNSSDRDFVPLNSPDGGVAGGERSGVPSLWSEIDAAEPVDELVSLERNEGSFRRRSMRTAGVDEVNHRSSPFLNDLVHVNKSGREERLNSSKHSGLSVHSSIAPQRQRMRSRSAGRQSVARLTGVRATNPYGTIGVGAYSSSTFAHRASVVPYQDGKNSPYRQQERPHSAARLRNTLGGVPNSSANYYSSDSASSPPPEMPLLSGVPPPGLHKQPAVLVPARKLNVQLHKPAAAPK